MRKRENFLEESGLDYETYKQCVGISTRNKVPIKKQWTPSEKIEEKKKIQIRKETSTPAGFI